MPTAIDIVNRGLLIVGSRPIAALDTSTDTGTRALLIYPQSRRTVFTMHKWNCLVTRDTLTADDPQPAEYVGLGTTHTLPADFMRIVAVSPRRTSYRIESGLLVTDTPGVQIIYIRDEEDPDDWDPLVEEVVAARFAYDMAMTMGGSAERTGQLLQLFQDRLADARFADSSQHDEKESVVADAWNNARFMDDPPDSDWSYPFQEP